jgi:uncharacterized protein
MTFHPPTPLELDAVRRKFMDLLILQSTPFCNLDCSYCYLPHRTDRRRMSDQLLERIFATVLPSAFVGPKLTVVWHAGEPLTLGTGYYRNAFRTAERHRRSGTAIAQNFQTNGVLIDEAWCELFREHNIHPGLSIDGPASYHDARRRYRNGKGSHADALRGLRLLRKCEIQFHVISVLTAEALHAPDEWFDFFCSEGIESVGFNVEEIEAANTKSSLAGPDAVVRFRSFFRRILERNEAAGRPIALREFKGAGGAIRHGCADSHELEPLRILSVDVEGKAYTFSPELVGHRDSLYGDFSIGQITTADLETLLGSPQVASQFRDIRAGVNKCAKLCAYYNWCGGGSPSNKLFENGSFDSTETMFCRLVRQGVLEETLLMLEKVLNSPTSSKN